MTANRAHCYEREGERVARRQAKKRKRRGRQQDHRERKNLFRWFSKSF